MIKLRMAEKKDCKILYNWANDLKTRRSRFDSKKISSESHEKWFFSSLKKKDRYIFIAINERKSIIGQIRLDKINNRVYEFDVTVAPEYRGHGYGEHIIKGACNIFLKSNRESFFIARIKKSNFSSIKSFEKAGFFEVFDYKDINGYEIKVFGMYNSSRI